MHIRLHSDVVEPGPAIGSRQRLAIDAYASRCGCIEAEQKVEKRCLVSSSFHKKKTEILSESNIREEELRRVVDATGYTVTGIHTEPYEKKGLSLFHRDSSGIRKKA